MASEIPPNEPYVFLTRQGWISWTAQIQTNIVENDKPYIVEHGGKFRIYGTKIAVRLKAVRMLAEYMKTKDGPEEMTVRMSDEQC